MRTTVDVDEALLKRAKRLADSENRTLGSVVGDALVAYLGKRKPVAKDPPFELIVRGSPRGRFPTASELADIDDEEDMARLGMRGAHRRASS
jgi:predicted transcriptional regulator